MTELAVRFYPRLYISQNVNASASVHLGDEGGAMGKRKPEKGTLLEG
jgi:hypothetical protein